MNVHRAQGPGLTQDAYEKCLSIELRELEPRVRLEKFAAGLLGNFNVGTLRKGDSPDHSEELR